MSNYSFRKAGLKDYPVISRLLLDAKLPADEVEKHIENFIILESNNTAIGAIGVEIYGSSGLLRSFVITEVNRNKGLGLKLYERLIESAKEKGITKIFLLTETAEKFFNRQGFKVINRDIVDEPVKNSVEFKSACPQSAICMMLKLS